MADIVIDKIFREIKKTPYDYQLYEDIYYLCCEGRDWSSLKKACALIEENILMCFSDEKLMRGLYDLHKRSLLAMAADDFDSYMLYIEWNREPEKQFYKPRREKLLPIVEEMQNLADDKIDLLCISLPPGVGKALANDTKVLTRNGWKKHGDLVVGDEVIGLDGEFKKVLAVHPKCMLDRAVTFTNGERVVCHENHEWMVRDRQKTPIKTNYETLSVKDIEKRRLTTGEIGKRGGRYVIQLPDRPIIVGEKKDLPIDPYFLGAWLGDGTNTNPTICTTEQDKCIIDRIERGRYKHTWKTVHKTTGCLYYGFSGQARKDLQIEGMCYSRKATPKHIPDIYLTASIEQRLELLAGLLDTDGTLSGSKYQYSTADLGILDGVCKLVATFGWRTSVMKHDAHKSSFGIEGRKPTYTIGFTPNIPIPCEVERKRNMEPHKQRRIAIESIEKVDPVEGNCITVEGGMYLVGETLLPTHNSTLAIFFLTWLAGREPNKPMLTASHSNSFIRGVYDECLRILDRNGEYLWHDVFPYLSVSNTNAKDCRIDIDKRQRFETLEFTSIGTGNAGLYRAETLLYCDDLVSGYEVAVSRERLDKLWEVYATDLRQRKKGDFCKELHIATRWSVHDIIGRLEEMNQGNERAKFITIPAMDENDESNFDYHYGVGFSTEFYRNQREIMDDVNWRALYMNQPIEREGLLYSADELKRFLELPDGDPDAILSVCDTKDKGSDYCVMPIAYQYGREYYIVDFICDNGNPEIIDERLADYLVRYKVQLSRFESNSAGRKVAIRVDEMMRKKGGRTKITTKYTTANKATKIVVSSPTVKDRFVFWDESRYPSREYKTAMQYLCGYTMVGKNRHDDVPDAMAQLVEFIESMESGRVEIFKRPW